MKTKISIALEFCTNPKGRYASHGSWNGTRFREEFLLPPLKNGGALEISLEGMISFRPSFFDSLVYGQNFQKVL